MAVLGEIMEVSLYEFSLGSRVWRYAGAEGDVMANSFIWKGAPISHDRINQSGEAVADSSVITASRNIIPAQIWLTSPPTNVMDIRILSGKFGREDSSEYKWGVKTEPIDRVLSVGNVYVQYVGEISQCRTGQPGMVMFDIETLAATMSRAGLRLGWQRQCPHAVYDPRTCKADKSANEITAIIVSVNGPTVVVSHGGGIPANGFYAGGLMEFLHNIKGAESLTIEASEGNTLQMFGGTLDLSPGMPVKLYRGCDQSPGTCQSFGNYGNYGGIPHLPGTSPFNGVDNPIF